MPLPVGAGPRFFFGASLLFPINYGTIIASRGEVDQTSALALTRATGDPNPMAQAYSVYSTPPINTSADNPQGAARQQKGLKLIAKLRKIIDRLLALASATPPPR